jgi:hypothetical protein
MKKIIGITMIAIPFIAIFVWGGLGLGWVKVSLVYGVVAALGVWIGIATYLADL